MIQAIIYDKVANTQTGIMGGEIRAVGHYYMFPGYEPPKKRPDQAGAKLEMIVEDVRRDQKVLVLTFDNDMQIILPDRGVEKILRFQ